MKTILIGLGSFGFGRYKTIKEKHKDLKVCIVEADIKKSELLIGKNDTFYTSLEEAIQKETPDFIINLTPPHIHTKMNSLAFDYNIPVLCEKPICEDFSEAIEIVKKSLEKNVPFMIAENYRRNPINRKLHKLIKDKEIGEIKSIEISFQRKYFEDKEYLVKRMKNPLLTDVSIHHLDMLRYITDSDGEKIFACNFNPKDSKYKGNASSLLIIKLENGAMATYNGSLASSGMETPWFGNWRIDGTKGIITLFNDIISIEKEGTVKQIKNLDDMPNISCLEEFISSLKEKRQPETSGADYLLSQALVHYAEESSDLGKMVEINKNFF